MKRSAIMGLTIFGAIAILTAPAVALKQPVITYHYDNQRTGWNQQETTLTPANVGPTSFGVIAQVVLDAQVDAQPLLVPSQQVTAGIYTVGPTGTYQVVYVATEGNTIYGIRASDGTVLLQRNLGTQVPTGPCNGQPDPPVNGIKGTPVIDVAANALYVIANILISGNQQTYQLFALNLNDLTDKLPPVTIAASHTLSDGTTYNFNAQYEQQRPGLLLASGNIYAGFGSYCDGNASNSRGWVLGWQESTLAPLAANMLTDTLARTSTNNFFLSTIWMSGYGIAAAPNGNLFFATGNSGPGTYDGVQNIQESVVKLDPTLKNVLSLFTPFNVNDLDSKDHDLSAGGVLVVPAQPGPIPNLAVVAGKVGPMYLLNRANLGGFTPGGPDNVLDEVPIGNNDGYCWCGPSYFMGPDGVGRIVSSGGVEGVNTIIGVWKIQTSPTVALVKEGAAILPLLGYAGVQDAGTFTTVSSNGTQDTIIWATGRPTNKNTLAIHLYAYAAAPSSGALKLLYSSRAGTWPNVGYNANIVPVVANGHVFVASNQQLTIFGLGGGPFVPPAAAAAKPAALKAHAPPHQITGVLEHVDGPVLTLRTRAGNIARVDDSDALLIGVLVPGNAYGAQGTYYDSTGALRAHSVGRAKPSPAGWPPDR
ncbi:MAG: hypothetical protein CR217_12205 [Beijerinckiaceae bacterium]|nr:MAG: hypothetical protein CR217_12205 [Beijerinckiaceae bacterium]